MHAPGSGIAYPITIGPFAMKAELLLLIDNQEHKYGDSKTGQGQFTLSNGRIVVIYDLPSNGLRRREYDDSTGRVYYNDSAVTNRLIGRLSFVARASFVGMVRKSRPSPLGLLFPEVAVPEVAMCDSYSAHAPHLHETEAAAPGGPSMPSKQRPKGRRNSLESPIYSIRQRPPLSPFSDFDSPMSTLDSPTGDEPFASSLDNTKLYKWIAASRDSIHKEGSEQCGSFRRTSAGDIGEACDFVRTSSDIDRRTSSAFDMQRLTSVDNGFSPRSSNSSGAVSAGRWPSLPKWPHLDPVAFRRGKALLGSMEMDPTCFSRDDLCHLALEIFEAAGLPDELA
ncbi:hypothetical protein T484DRAFT_3638267, partial [Baffinella frigidus]